MPENSHITLAYYIIFFIKAPVMAFIFIVHFIAITVALALLSMFLLKLVASPTWKEWEAINNLLF